MKAKRLFALLLALALSLGCALAEQDAGDPVLAYVYDEPIRLSDVEDMYAYLLEMYEYEGYDMSDEENLTYVRQEAMANALQVKLILRYAAAHGLDQFTEEDLAELDRQNDEVWESAVQQYLDYYATEAELANPDRVAELREQAIAYYEGNGDTRESTLASLRQSMIIERVQADVSAGIAVTEEEITEAYNGYVEEDRALMSDPSNYEFYTAYMGYEPAYIPAGFRAVQRILLEPDEAVMNDYLTLSARWEEQVNALETGDTAATATDLDVAATEAALEESRLAVIASVQPQLDDIYAKAQAGVPFEEILAEYVSEEDLRDDPALLSGIFVYEDSSLYDPAFVRASFSVSNPGEISEPFVGTYGVYVVCYLRDVPEGPLEMTEEVRNLLYEQLLEEKETEHFTGVVEGWMSEAEITYTEEGEFWRVPDDPEYLLTQGD